MFGNRYTERRKERGLRQLKKAKDELALTNEILGIERETKIVREQIRLLEVTDTEITKKQLSLMGQANRKLIKAQKEGMDSEVKKALPAMLESRHRAGGRMMTGNMKMIASVKERAKS